MNLVARHSKTMLLISIVTFTLLITFTTSHPVSYTTYDNAGISANHPQVVLLVEHTMPELENEMFERSNDPGSTVVRTKRIGSLSIVNSLDVLRGRVLLELARRKALQDQRQIDANRRYLETIGKRSLPSYNRDASKTVARTGLEYALDQQEKHHERTERLPGSMQDWFQGDDDPVLQNDQTRRVQTNELRLL